MARSASYLERGIQPLEILSIGSCVPDGIDNERPNRGTTWDGNGSAHMHNLMKALQSRLMIGSALESTDEPYAGKSAQLVLAGDLETNRASFDLPEAEAKSVAGYNVDCAGDAILNSSLLVEANISGSQGLILTETRGGSLPTSKYSMLGKRSRSDNGDGGGVSSSTKPRLPAVEEDPGDRSEIERALDQLELAKIKEQKYLLDEKIRAPIESEKGLCLPVWSHHHSQVLLYIGLDVEPLIA
ncbi:NADH-ubiquinone oxidoreductase chain 1 [Capsicum chinense]|nr:NADH-ubiquinone oxidoreductase chain 1 [Capsicum chinense]